MSPTSQATVKVAKPNMSAGQLGVKHINKYFKSFQINIGDRKICMSRKKDKSSSEGQPDSEWGFGAWNYPFH